MQTEWFFAFVYNWYTSMVWSPYHEQQAAWARADDDYANTFWRR